MGLKKVFDSATCFNKLWNTKVLSEWTKQIVANNNK